MSDEQGFLKAIEKLRKQEKKKNFNQTIDLIVNLKNFDVRREAFNTFIQLPVKVKDKKIAGFFEKDSKVIDTIKKEEFQGYKEKKDFKKLIKQYDFFISNAKLMPSVATTFGRYLGPAGKMPSPQLGVVPSEDDKIVEALVLRINSNIRIRVKEPSIKVAIAKESLNDNEIMQNAITVYHKLLELLPKKKENIRNIKIKLSMGEPVNVEL
jgi:large subunit ribosomal protein L1